ncbi:MAG TPA: hypothetical protein VIY49_18030 [Bryobacteraceae bacterium]
MLRIETETDGSRIILRLIGRIGANCIEELRERVENRASILILDLAEVHLVDLPSVRFLRDCQDQKIELRNCRRTFWSGFDASELKDKNDGRSAENSATAEHCNVWSSSSYS